MAEREGFEPSVEFPLHTLSKRAPSTTRTSLHFRINDLRAVDPRLPQDRPDFLVFSDHFWIQRLRGRMGQIATRIVSDPLSLTAPQRLRRCACDASCARSVALVRRRLARSPNDASADIVCADATDSPTTLPAAPSKVRENLPFHVQPETPSWGAWAVA